MTWLGDFEYARSVMGTGAVCLFLVLSGYGCYISYTLNGLSAEYWNKKIKKIFVPYWIVTVIYLLVLRFKRRTLSAVIILKNLLCIDYDRNIDGTMWYMSLLVIFYILFFILFITKLSDVCKIAFLFLCAFCIKELASSFSACSWQFLQNYLSFPIGVGLGWLLNLSNEKAKVNQWFSKLYLGTSLMCFVTLSYCYGKVSLQIIALLCAFTAIGLVQFLFSICKFKNISIWSWIGTNSYFLYLTEGKLLDLRSSYSFEGTGLFWIVIFFLLLYLSVVFLKVLLNKGEKTFFNSV